MVRSGTPPCQAGCAGDLADVHLRSLQEAFVVQLRSMESVLRHTRSFESAVVWPFGLASVAAPHVSDYLLNSRCAHTVISKEGDAVILREGLS